MIGPVTADPTCTRCGRRMVWIGIGPGAVPECPLRCAPVPPNSRCPKCRSLKIEKYTLYQFPIPSDTWHCWDCGKIFDKKDAV